jgi:thymidylate synthase (FAD)
LKYLLQNKHGTPFEQGFMAHFHVRVPLFIMREWVRHRIGFSYNEESGRYVELRPDFFDPDQSTIRTQTGKPGAYKFEEHPDRGVREAMCGDLVMQSRRGFDLYRHYLDLGVAKEQARWFLGLTLFTEFRWTCNSRSLMNFLALRNAPDAMWEIQQYAKALEEIFAVYMPKIHKIFVENGRVAP